MQLNRLCSFLRIPTQNLTPDEAAGALEKEVRRMHEKAETDAIVRGMNVGLLK